MSCNVLRQVVRRANSSSNMGGLGASVAVPAVRAPSAFGSAGGAGIEQPSSGYDASSGASGSDEMAKIQVECASTQRVGKASLCECRQ